MINRKPTALPRMTATGMTILAVIGLLSMPAYARFGRGGFGGGGFGRGGGGFRMGGDGFAGGNPSHTAWSQHSGYSSRYSSYHPSAQYGTTPHQSASNANQTRYNEAQSMNQTRYSEAQSMQNKHYQSQSALSHQQYNQASNLQSNSSGHWGDPYGGCCGSSGGSTAGAAAVGMMGGMAMGATMESAVTPRQPTTVVENVAPSAPMPYGTTLPYLPPGATPTQVNGMDCYYSNGTYYRPVFNGSQVVYVASPM
jgi:hypothetical protein